MTDSKGKYPTEYQDVEKEMPKTADEVEAEKGKPAAQKSKITKQQIGTVFCSLFLMAIGGLIVHATYPFFHPVTFRNIKAYYASIGQEYRGVQIEELYKTCPDGQEITLSCISLAENTKIQEISQAVPGVFRK